MMLTFMTSEQQQALQEHIQAIAKILYEDTPSEQLTSLIGIQQAVRSQIQKRMIPEVDVFYQNSHRHYRRLAPMNQKHSRRIVDNKHLGTFSGKCAPTTN